MISVAVTVFYLPNTDYGMYLKGKYYFSNFIKSTNEDEAKAAFRLWQKVGNKEAFAEALEIIPENSDVWGSFIKRSSSLYHDRENPGKYEEYLESLRQKLTHPAGKSAIHFVLGELYMNRFPEKSLEFFKTVINLNINPANIKRAQGNIHEIQHLNVGQVAPVFELSAINDIIFSSDNLRSKVVLLEFWSIHCGSCIKEIPALKRLYKSFKSDHFVLLNISLEHGEKVSDFIAEQQIPGNHILVDRDKSAKLLQDFNIQYIPTTYILDKNGKIAYKKLRGERLEEALSQLLTEK